MKLQKQLADKYKDKTYYKYTILVPNKLVKGLGWKAGQELKGTPVNEIGLLLHPK